MRCLDKLQVSALVDIFSRTDELARLLVPLLQRDARKSTRTPAVVPEHVSKPLLPVAVVEERRVEPRRVDIKRVRPRPLYRRRGHDVVVRVLEGAVLALDVGIDQVELLAVVGEAGRPYLSLGVSWGVSGKRRDWLTPQLSGSPRMSSWDLRLRGRTIRSQLARSFEWWIWTPMYRVSISYMISDLGVGVRSWEPFESAFEKHNQRMHLFLIRSNYLLVAI